MQSISHPVNGLETRPRVAVLIDAGNIGPSSAGDVFRIACRLGDPILRRAYGTPQRFMGDGGWQNGAVTVSGEVSA